MKKLKILQMGKLSVLFFVAAFFVIGCGEVKTNRFDTSKNVLCYQNLDSAFFYSYQSLTEAEKKLEDAKAKAKAKKDTILYMLKQGEAYLNHANLFYLCSRFDSAQYYISLFDRVSQNEYLKKIKEESIEKLDGEDKTLKNYFTYLEMLKNTQQIDIYIRRYNFSGTYDLLLYEPLLSLHRQTTAFKETDTIENKKRYAGFYGTQEWFWAKTAYNIRFATYNFQFGVVNDKMRHIKNCFDALFQLSRVSKTAIQDSVKNIDEAILYNYYYVLANVYYELAETIDSDSSENTKQTIINIWNNQLRSYEKLDDLRKKSTIPDSCFRDIVDIDDLLHKYSGQKIAIEITKEDNIKDFYFTDIQELLRKYYNSDINNDSLVKYFYNKSLDTYLTKHEELENRTDKQYNYWLANFKQDIAIIKMNTNEKFLLDAFHKLDAIDVEQYLLASGSLFSKWGGEYPDYFQNCRNKCFLANYYYSKYLKNNNLKDLKTSKDTLNSALKFFKLAIANNAYNFETHEIILKIQNKIDPSNSERLNDLQIYKTGIFINNRTYITEKTTKMYQDSREKRKNADEKQAAVKDAKIKTYVVYALIAVIILFICGLSLFLHNKLKEETLKQGAFTKATECYESFVENRKKPDFIEDFHKSICENILGCKTETDRDKFAIAICYAKQGYKDENILEGVCYSEKDQKNPTGNRKGRYHPVEKKPAMFVYKAAKGEIPDPHKRLPDWKHNPLIFENIDDYKQMEKNFKDDFSSEGFDENFPDETQSAIFYPIMYGNKALGVFTIQKTEPYDFKNEKLALNIFIQLIAVYLFEEQKSLKALSDTLQTIRQNVNCQQLISKTLTDKISIEDIDKNDENFTIIKLFNDVYFLLFGTAPEDNKDDKFSFSLWLKEKKDENKRKWLLEQTQYSQEEIDDAEYVMTNYTIERFGEKNIKNMIFPQFFKLEDDYSLPAVFCYQKNIINLQQDKQPEVFERRNWKGGNNLKEFNDIMEAILKDEEKVTDQNIKTIVEKVYGYKKRDARGDEIDGKTIYMKCLEDRNNYKKLVKEKFNIDINSNKDTDLNNINFLLQAQNAGLRTNSLLYYPIISNKEVVGVLSFQHEDEYYFEQVHVEYLKIIADAIGDEIYKDNEKEIEKLKFFTALAAIVNHRSKSHFVTLGGSISRFNYKLSSDSQIKELKEYKLYNALAGNMFKSHTYLERSFRIFEYVTPEMAKKDFTEFSIDEIVESVKEEIEFKMEGKEKLKDFWNNTVIHSIIPQDFKIISNETIFKEIFYNLIFNTIEHGFDKNNANQKIDVHINVSEKDDQYFISYENNGNPINEEEKNTIFNLGHSKKTGKGNRLSGVGLFACKYLINDILNGQIVLNRELKNVKFEITIPKK